MSHKAHLNRSIPASAGEPGGNVETRTCAGVYPRECGGTDCVYYTPVTIYGLSPRVRGNR